MPADDDFFAAAADSVPASDAQRADIAAQPPARPGAPRRRWLALVAFTAAIAVASSYGLSAFRPVQYDNLEAHTDLVNDPAGWSALYTAGGAPSRWDPCQPIHYVVNLASSPPSGARDLAAAIARVEKASGLRFVFDGETAELPGDDRPATRRAADGTLAWAPVLVAWQPLGRAGGVEGETVPIAVSGPDGGSIVTATVAINSDLLLPPGFGPGISQGLVILHELGHAVGLGHVGDPAQVMYPQVKGGYADFGAGDRRGLTALGAAAGCHPAPPARELRIRRDGTG